MNFNASIYIGLLAILMILFHSSRRNFTVNILAAAAMGVITFLALADFAFSQDARTTRDANGKITSTSTRSGASKTVRDPKGRTIETRRTHAGTTTVRDAGGRIIRTEKK